MFIKKLINYFIYMHPLYILQLLLILKDLQDVLK